MLQSFSILKGSVASRPRSTESFVFFLHYRVTFLLLMFACLLVSSKQFVGDRIRCLAGPYGDISTALLDAYCWAASTYSVSSAYFKEVGIEVPHPGIGESENTSEYTYRNYYQYIHLVLFFQALLFYFPHMIWKNADNYMNNFYSSIEASKTTTSSQDTKAEKETESQFDLAATYIEDRWGTHLLYGLQYILCEVLSIINLIVQSYLVDVFLGGEFLGLGYFYIPYYNAKRFQDPISMFPLVTNCYFKKYGASGFVDTIDALCVLPINALNVKIYLFIWVWFAVLLGLSFASLLHFCLAWFFPKYRNLPLILKSLVFRNRVDHGYYKRVVMRGDFGDWFVLSSIKNNMDSLEFSHLMENLWYKLSNVGTETKEP
ncbi:innexin shaking-B [Caerostris darwini]|uniref:Innexin n=1 Tax=Caerostris darwini TaxID=1538125 RepID=A0AAV4X4R1_9ARAC|nr:innexin shaking-B [Caerostris darwini]